MIYKCRPNAAWKRIEHVAGMMRGGRLKMGPGNLMWAVLNVTTDEELDRWNTGGIVDLAEKIGYFIERESKGLNKGQEKWGKQHEAVTTR